MKTAGSPLWIKRFRHNGKYYCYDVGVNNILEIDQTLDRFLAGYPGGTGAPDVEPSKMREAEATFSDYRAKTGGFLDRRKIRLQFPFTPAEYERLLGRLINHMVLNVTNGCNMRCRYCRTTAADPAALRGPREMSWKTIRKALNFFIDHASYIIEETNRDLVLGFYGGEPLLEYDNIVRAVAFLRDNHSVLFPRFRFSLTTNGTLLTEKMIHFFIEHNFHLLLSLDGPAELHDRYRKLAGGKNSFAAVEKKLALIRDIDDRFYSEKIGFSIVLSPEFRLTDVVEFFRRNHFSEKRVYMFSMVEAKWTDFFEAFDLQAEFHKLRDDEDFLKKAYKKNKCAGISDVLLNNLFEGSLQDIHGRVPLLISDDIYPNGICLPGLHKVFVGTDGNLHLCEKTDNNQAIGDLDRGFDVEKVFALIDGYIQTTGHCRDCWAVRLCKDCFLSALTERGYSKEEKKSHAEEEKTLSLMVLRTMSKSWKRTARPSVRDFMSQALSAMRLNTWVAVSLAFFLAGGSGFPADREKNKAVNANFVVESRLSGDEDKDPYFFADILKICSNSRFIYIADWKEAKITILDLDLKFIRRIGRRGQGPGEFSQIFADLACDENRIYLLTINRVYIFTREGDYESEVTLKFIPRRIFPVENGWLFKLDDSEETIWETDWKGDVHSRSIRSAKVLDSNCPPMFANPEVYRDSAGRIYLMETKEYRIRRLAAGTKAVEKDVKRSTDFDALTCRKETLGENGVQNMYTGGFSWFLENENELLYFFRNSRGGLCVDSYRNDGSLCLIWSGAVKGGFRPLAVIQGGRFLGVSGDEHHVLAVARLMKNAP